MMISNRQANKRLRAQLASLKATLEQTPESDKINRLSVLADIQRLEKELEESSYKSIADQFNDDQYIELAVSGKPVIAQKGIDIVFAGKLITEFQSLVSSIVASRQGKTSNMGPIKHYRQSNLHITGVVRGSFGFVIEPIAAQMDLFELETARAINLAAEMLVSISKQDTKLDAQVLEDVSDRVLVKLSKFMNHLATSDATLSIATPKLKHTFSEASIRSSIEKLELTEIRENIVFRHGIVNGILPERHKFELLIDGEIISGSVLKSISSDQLKDWQAEFLDRETSVQLRERALFRKGELVRTSYALIAFE